MEKYNCTRCLIWPRLNQIRFNCQIFHPSIQSYETDWKEITVKLPLFFSCRSILNPK
jgi:hypothetical protein